MLKTTIEDFTVKTSCKDPVPGGGGVSALCGALAASLAEMVTSLTTGKKKYAEYEEEIQEIMQKSDCLRKALLACIEKDAEAFAPLAKAYAMDKDAPGYREKMEQCLKDAANPPFEILKLCTKIIVLDERLSVIGSKLAVSDAATSAMLAHGAMYGALINVTVNTRLMKDRAYAETIDEQAQKLVQEYGPRALRCYEDIMRRLNHG